MEEILKILLIDDDEVDRIAVRRALKAARVQLEVREAINCLSAIAILKNETFDCIFLDYLLPDGDGLTLVQQIRALGVKAPLIVLTGQGDEQIAVELMKAGASDYISKAKLSPENLSKSLHNALRLYRAEMEAAVANQRRMESEERYRLVLEGANDGIWDWDIAKNEIYCNDRFFEITGLSHAEFAATYEAFCELLHPEDRSRVMEAVKAHLQQGVEFNVELRLRHISGKYRYCVTRAKAQRNGQSYPFRMSGTVTDMTERKQAEDAVRFLAEASSILSASLDYQTTLKNLAHLIVPQVADWCAVDLLEANKSWQRVAVTGVGGVEWIPLQGTEKNPKTWTPLSSAEGGDNTLEENLDRKTEAEEGFFHTEQLSRSNPAEFQIDSNWPAGTPRVLASGRSELYYECPSNLLGFLGVEGEYATQLRMLGRVSAMCVPIRGHRQVLGTLTLVSAAGGRRYDKGSLALAEDLANRAAAAIDNARLYQEAQEANRMKDEFLAIVSHELRTPLNAMLGWAQLLKSRKLDPQKTAHAIETIERNARSQSQMIEDLLDVSRIIRGKLNFQRRPVNLTKVISLALDTVRPAAAAKGVELEWCFDSDAGLVSGDSDRLQQIVWNLLSNAVKFTPKGGHVLIALENLSSRVQIRVSDTGVGITPDFLPFVFDRFRQADGTPTRSYGGLGLGLAIVRHLVELHGGSVGAQSLGKGQGATFTVQLPTIQGVANSLPSGVEKPVDEIETDVPVFIQDEKVFGGEGEIDRAFRSADPLTLSGVRVLVVDNEEDVRELLSAILKQYGASPIALSSAAEAIAALVGGSGDFDILVSDIGMPFEDGYTLIRKVRAMEKDRGGFLPAVALTAYARESDRACALEAGYQQHLPKPIEPSELVAAIADLATRRLVAE